MTKKELDNLSEGVLTTIVDNEVAKDNVSKLANSLGYEYKVDKKSDKEYYIHITKGEATAESNVCIPDTFKDMTIAFASDTMGKGSEELGKILINLYVYINGSNTFSFHINIYNGEYI